ncbi:MAG: hypothetical protein WD425_01940 [Nitrospirales bacterium]
MGLKVKLDLLREKHNLHLQSTPYLESLAYARNCITHRHGIVAETDLKNGASELTIEWKGMDVFVSTPDGEEITIIPSGGREEIFLKDGGNGKLRVDVVRTLKFAQGQMIQLSPHHLAEICWFVQRMSRQFIQETQSYVKKQGIPEKG